MLGVFVLKRNGKASPTPLDQISAQSDNLYLVFVHQESKSVKTTILIAKYDIVEMSIFVKLSKWGYVMMEKGKKRLS